MGRVADNSPMGCTNLLVHRILYPLAVTLPLVVLAVLVTTAASLCASDEHTLDTITIDASESVQITGDVVFEEHTGNLSRIDRAQIERSAPELGYLLDSQAGIQQQQTAGFGSFSTISLRAAGGAQVGIYLDGILLNSSGNSIIDLSTLEVLNMQAVDIYRGATPLQLGHGSIGGAINLLTLRPKDKSQSTIRLGVGSFSQAGLQLSHQGSSNQWDWSGAVSKRQSDNDFDFNNDNRTELNPFDDVVEPRYNNQVQRAAGLVKAGYRQSENLRSDAMLQLTEKIAEIPDIRNSAENRAKTDSKAFQLQFSQTVDNWLSWNTRHTVYAHQFDVDYTDLQGRIDGQTAFLIQSASRTTGAKSYWERFSNFGTTGLSIEFRNESLDSADLNAAQNNFSASRDLLLGTAHLALIDDSDRWLFSPAIRWQQSKREGPITSPTGEQTSDTSSQSNIAFQSGLSYQATNEITIKANAGQYFREPSFAELYQSFGLVNSNTALVSEEGINVDIGLTYETDTLTLSTTAFHNRRDELIVTTFNSRGVGTFVNTGKAFVNGLELSSTWQPHEMWQIQANATFKNPRIKDNNASFENRLLPGEARRLYFARVSYQPTAFSIWYEWRSNQDRFYDKANIRPAQDTSVHDMGLNWHGRKWQLSTRIQNILDNPVEDFNGFARPGRTFSLALTRTL